METQIVRAADVDVDQLQSIAKMLALSGFFEAAREPNQAVAQMAVKVLAGREMGFGPFASVQGIYLIQGKPSVSANLMASSVKNSPRYDYRVRKMEDAECVLEFFERDINGKLESIGVSSFTAQQARTAGVKNMDKFPRNMLFARALSNGVRWYCPNVFNGNAVYIPEELGADTNEEGEVVVQARQPAQPVTPATTEPGNGNGNGHGDPLDNARKAFHAAGVEIFGKQWDAARPWLLKRYTAKNTPDLVREHTNNLTAVELQSLRSDMNRYAGKLQTAFAQDMQAQAGAALATVDMETVAEIPL